MSITSGEFYDLYEPKLDLSQAFAQFYYIEEILANTQLPNTLVTGLYRPLLERQFEGFINRVKAKHKEFCENIAGTIVDYLTLACFGEARHGKRESARFFENMIGDRTSAYINALRYNQKELLEKLADLFNNSAWKGGYGGPSWGNMATTALKYYELPPHLFIDVVANLVHNGGACYDKGIFVHIQESTQQQFLEFRRQHSLLTTYYNIGVIAPWLVSVLNEAYKFRLIKKQLLDELLQQTVRPLIFPPRVVWEGEKFDKVERGTVLANTFKCGVCGKDSAGDFYKLNQKGGIVYDVCHQCISMIDYFHCTYCTRMYRVEDIMVYSAKDGKTLYSAKDGKTLYLCPSCKRGKPKASDLKKKGIRGDRYRNSWVKPGTEVKYVSGDFGYSVENPVFSQKSAFTYGIIKDVFPREVGGLPILVEWNNGAINSYYQKDLLPMQKKDYDLIKAFKKNKRIDLLKIGDRVILESSHLRDNKYSPRWGGKEGFIAGTVFSINEDECSVEWDNGAVNRFLPILLTKVSKSTESIPKGSTPSKKLETKSKTKFALFQKVKYVSGMYGDSPSNPLWNGKYGSIEGTVTKTIGKQSYAVSWDNGKINTYDEDDLAFAVPIDYQFEIGDEVKYISGNHGDTGPTGSNPLWMNGHIIGKIIEYNDENGWYNVDWSNGTTNTYKAEDLALIEAKDEQKEKKAPKIPKKKAKTTQSPKKPKKTKKTEEGEKENVLLVQLSAMSQR